MTSCVRDHTSGRLGIEPGDGKALIVGLHDAEASLFTSRIWSRSGTNPWPTAFTSRISLPSFACRSRAFCVILRLSKGRWAALRAASIGPRAIRSQDHISGVREIKVKVQRRQLVTSGCVLLAAIRIRVTRQPYSALALEFTFSS